MIEQGCVAPIIRSTEASSVGAGGAGSNYIVQNQRSTETSSAGAKRPGDFTLADKLRVLPHKAAGAKQI
jgi:hypothetical protein